MTSRKTAAVKPVRRRAVSASVPGAVSDAASIRARADKTLAHYEAARPTRTRRVHSDRSTGTQLVQRDGAAIRAQARYLERNHDLARGALNVLVRNVVGATGIGIEPQPRNNEDDIHDDCARRLQNLWRDWTRQPEVTATLDWATAQQLACRSWLRDGEVFAQCLEGPVPLLDHGTVVPFSVELLEAQMVPLDLEDEARRIHCGVETNAWNRPVAYHVYRRDPAEGFVGTSTTDTKRVAASRMLHVAMRDRIGQLRGISIFASTLTRFEDIKNYEESERIAAQLAANIAAFVKRGAGTDYAPPPEGTPREPRHLRLEAGAILDELAPGEELMLLDPKRPNPALVGFRQGQMRAAAAGMDISHSSLSRDYNGTYSAQRQELVEQDSAYALLSGLFIAQFVRPIWERFVDLAVASGALVVPPDVRLDTLKQADFRRPVMPWIDPKKEAEALLAMVRAGFRDNASVIRERGGSLHDTYERLAREQRLADELGLVLESDARHNLANDGRADAQPDDGETTPATPPATTGSASRRPPRRAH